MTWQPISTFNGLPGTTVMISNGKFEGEAILHDGQWYKLWSWSQEPIPNVTHWKQIEEALS